MIHVALTILACLIVIPALVIAVLGGGSLLAVTGMAIFNMFAAPFLWFKEAWVDPYTSRTERFTATFVSIVTIFVVVTIAHNRW